jgi:hypothetical protein
MEATKKSLLVLIVLCSSLYLVLIGIQVHHSSLSQQDEPTRRKQMIRQRKNQAHDTSESRHYFSLQNQTHHSALSFQQRLSSDLEDLSSVDYYACCGLGHRLVRMSLAADVAQRHQLALRSFWGWCDTTEVFSHLFRPQTRQELANVHQRNTTIQFHNEVPGYGTLVRRGKGIASCYCTLDKIHHDVRFYSSLRNRFRLKHRLQAFKSQHDWEKHTVLGLHVRAGNGEGGDFVYKGRGIANPVQWVQAVSGLVRTFWHNATATTQNNLNPPLLYIATDTPSIIALFRKELQDDMPVLDLPQNRVNEGQGVMFGAFQSVTESGAKCLQGWEDTVMDMMLLSYAHVVIAGTPSSFTQTLPMSLAFGQARPHTLPVAFCEVRRPTTDAGVTGPWLQCFDKYMDWCCHHKTWISFPHRLKSGVYKNISREYIKFLRPEIRPNGRTYAVRQRPENLDYIAWRPAKGNTTKNTFLPHDWKYAGQES